MDTLPKTHMEPENDGFLKESLFQGPIFRFMVHCLFSAMYIYPFDSLDICVFIDYIF